MHEQDNKKLDGDLDKKDLVKKVSIDDFSLIFKGVFGIYSISAIGLMVLTVPLIINFCNSSLIGTLSGFGDPLAPQDNYGNVLLVFNLALFCYWLWEVRAKLRSKLRKK